MIITLGYFIGYVICSVLAYITEDNIELLVARGSRMELIWGPAKKQKKEATKIAIVSGPFYFIGLVSFYVVAGIAYVVESI